MKSRSYGSRLHDPEQEEAFPGTDGGPFARGTDTGWRYPVRQSDLRDAALPAGSATLATHAEVVSQGDRAMGSDLARTRYGLDGSGIAVGVISDSFNVRGGLSSDVAAGELPRDTRILREGDAPFYTDEGRAMAQIIHDVAPGASILFASGFPSQERMAQSIRDLAAAGARVIVDDISDSSAPAFQDGVVNQAIQEVTAKGVVYVTAAGNHGSAGYSAPFEQAPELSWLLGNAAPVHEFAPGQDYITVNLPIGASVAFSFQWNDPSRSISPEHGTKTNLELVAYELSGDIAFRTTTDNIIEGDPIEFFRFTALPGQQTLRLKVRVTEGPLPEDFRLMILGNGLPVYIEELASNRNDSTVFGYVADPNAITVGAVDYRNTPAFGDNLPSATTFSSVGSSVVTYDTHGNRLVTPELRKGVSIMAPQDGDNSFFGWDSDSNGLPNFSGTSAAAPHVAALVALMLQANPDLDFRDIRNLLENSAIDMDDRRTPGFDQGFDTATGAGLVQATAVDFAATGVIDNPLHKSLLLGTHLDDHILGWGAREDAGDGSTAAVDLALYGYAGNDRLEGGAGSDLLDGGSGRDRLSGGGGDDRYVIDDPADLVVEAAGAGSDTVLASVSYALPVHVENLSLSGREALSAFGNAQDNVLTGNEAGNLIVGNGGNDTLFGEGGADTLIGGEGDDRISGGAGDDLIHANGGDNRIDAGAGKDVITAGNGDDVIVGGAGDDLIYANHGRNLFQLGGVREAATDGDDQIWAGSGGDTYALFFEDAEGGAAGFGHDTINGFRLAEGDRLLLFNEKAGYWDDPNTLEALVDAGQLTGTRSADGGDLTLTFAEGRAADSALTLKWFFWDNAARLSEGERGTAFGAEIRTADLTGILRETIEDGGSVGVSGPDFRSVAADFFLLGGHTLV